MVSAKPLLDSIREPFGVELALQGPMAIIKESGHETSRSMQHI
jgi:hypothetical protein